MSSSNSIPPPIEAPPTPLQPAPPPLGGAAAPPPFVPPTGLPTDPALLVRYLRSRHLATLQQLWTAQVLAHQSSLANRPGLKSRRNSSSGHHNSSHKRRRQSSPATATREEEAAAALQEEETALWESRRATFNAGQSIDEAHIYALGYILEPEGTADVYYHGPFALPPKKVTRAMMGETRLMIDFRDVENKAVWETAIPLFNGGAQYNCHDVIKKGEINEMGEEGQPIASELNEVNEASDRIEAWEMDAIAKFSHSCDARIAISTHSGSKGAGGVRDKLEMSNEQERERENNMRMGQQQQQFKQNQSYWR